MKKAFCFIVAWMIMTPFLFSQTPSTPKRSIQYPDDISVFEPIIGYEKEKGIEKGERGDLISKSVYNYDAKGIHIKTIISDNSDDNGQLRIMYICKYDAKGNLIEKNSSKFGYPRKTNYKYDDKNNLIEENDNTISFFPITIYKYDYDRIGNWIKKSTFRNDNQVEYTEREIDYY